MAEGTVLLVSKLNESGDAISIFRKGETTPILTQQAKANFRPYLHPIAAPDGNGNLTEYSPDHHKHQTGLYWGFTRVNGTGAEEDTLKKWFYRKDKPADIQAQIGRDFFHHPEGDYWKRLSVDIVEEVGDQVSWKTVYHMLDEGGEPILEETQIWRMREVDKKFLIELEWQGKAIQDITVNEFDYGGMFLRMPWKKGIKGRAINAARQQNEKAEGQRAMWVDVGMEIEGRKDFGHIAIFDHPQNAGFPQTWRVDGQLGIGPVRARMGDWHIKQGEVELIRHQLVAYTGELSDLEITDLWEDFAGNEGMYSTASLWGIAQKEGLEARFLSPEEAVEEMSIATGFKVNAWAAEPMITQPMAFCWDDKGRMWVAENRDYESRGSGFSNSGDSRILILEDTDRDGIADSKKVFLEGIPFPAAIAVGFDGLFLGAPPNLLFVPDRDKDDKADMEDIEIRLTGWGIRDRHETINSLHWGPDGWLYGLEGFATPSKIRKPNGKAKLYAHKEPFPEDLLDADGVDINGGVWRYHPVKDRFEVVAHGFSNPWGIDYDAKGQLFITACVIPHLFHVIPGGVYHRQGGKHFNPYVYSDIQTIVNHSHRSAHGGARVYQSDAFPQEHKGRLFMANIHEHAVLADILEPKGSGFVAHHGEDFMVANNAQWIGFSMEIGPGGNLYVLDWHDADICGKEVLNKETGRIFRITPENSLAENWEGRYGDLTSITDLQLADLQTSKSDWHARRARIILQYRATQREIQAEALARLKEVYTKGVDPDHRLRAMWALHLSGGFSKKELADALQDKDEYIRAWAIQLLCEDQSPSTAVIATFASMARKDPSPAVRLYLAAALQRVGAEAKWEITQGLLAHAKDVEDHNIPKMIWYGIEGEVEKNIEMALALANQAKVPSIVENMGQRLVDGDQLEPLIAAIANQSKNAMHLMEGMRKGLEGRSDLKAPANWERVYAKLASNKKLGPLALEIAQLFGDAEAAKQFMAVLTDTSNPIAERQKAIQALADQQWPDLQNELLPLLEEPQMRIAAIRALAAYDNYTLGKQLLENYPDFTSAEKQEAIQAMASRSVYGNLLAGALKEGYISRQDIPAYVARQLRRVVGNGFVEVWGPIDQLSNQKDIAYRKYKALLDGEALQSANIADGKTVFQQTCGACHQMFGEGGLLGPDLTGSNRQNLDYLLSNVLDPSGEIQDDYKMLVITSQDGRTYVGNIIAEDERQLTLRVVGQDAVIINKSEIQSRDQTDVSMMPEGLFDALSDQQVIDLVAYLQVANEVALK